MFIKIKLLYLQKLMQINEEHLDRGQMIQMYKWCWIHEILIGATKEEIDLELSICEELEDYEQCQGIVLALEYCKLNFINLIDKKWIL